MSMLKVDLELVKKYNVAGPRYTSYPPATQFTSAIAPELFIEKIRKLGSQAFDIDVASTHDG